MNLFNVYQKYNIPLSRGEGVYVYDENNQKYLDLYGGHGVISIGHTHPTYISRLKKQLDKIGFYSNLIPILEQEELAIKLAEQSDYPNHQLFLCNSGAEANENALKLASFHTGKRKVIAFNGSFHGRTSAALNITDNSKILSPLNTNNYPVDFIPLNEERALLDSLQSQEVCAVIVEGIQGVGGLEQPTAAYLKFLATACKTYGALLILDEIQSGYGRTGKFFAHQYADIKADIVSIAKGMGNGFPLAGILIHPDIQPKTGMLGTTFGGNHLACAAGIAVLDVLTQEKLLQHVKDVNKQIIDELKSINSIKEIKGRGLMLGIELAFPVKELRSRLLYDYNIFTGSSANPNLLRILPPLCITYKQMLPFFSALKALLK